MERVGDILKALLSEGTLKKGKKYISFYSSWQQIAGETLSDHTKAVDIQRGSLIVEVDHPGWFQMFLFKEQAILRRVKRRFPELKIKNIKVRVVPATDKKAADRLYGEILQRGKNEKH